MVFALVASAAAWRQCAALQIAAAGAVNLEQGVHAAHRHADATDHGEVNHHAMHHQHAADDPAAPAADDHDCMKCCTICTVANAVVPAATVMVTFTVSAHIFSRNRDMWNGSTLAVDPGIPKHIA